MKMSEEQKQQILSLLNEASESMCMMMVEEGELEEFDSSDQEHVEWNMIDDGHYLVEEVFESVLGEDYDYNEVVADLFG